ncbi:ABC-three component system middle component 1 [Vibrio harveyi]
MKVLINSLFKSQGLHCHFNNELDLYGHTEGNKTSYWLVIYNKLNLSPEEQSSYLKICKKYIQDPALEKNINLLIVWEVDKLDERTSKIIHHIEEDCFFFKKHVLPYSKNELISLNNEISERGLEKVFDEVITSPEVFLNYKNMFGQGGWESLLYRIAIKFTGLSIKSKSTSDLSNLELNIERRIKKSQNEDVLNLISDVIFGFSCEQIKEINAPNDLLDAIINKSSGVDL